VTAEPSTVALVGAASVVEVVTEAITEPVSVTGRSASFVETVTIGSPDPAVRLSTPGSARVSVTVTAAPVEWIVPGVPVQIHNARRPVRIVPAEVTVVARGPRDASGARAASFDASVDVAGLGAGRFDLPVRVVPPVRVGVARVEPAMVRVTSR
jgi:YbbR domain-containing protein